MEKIFSKFGKERSVWVLLFLCLLALSVIVVRLYDDSQFEVIYSLDRRENDKELVGLIDKADKYVYFAIYYFTKNNIAEALIRAKKRGVAVYGITDREAAFGSNKRVVEELRLAGVSVEVQKHLDGIMHVKALVTEKAYASGSYNWTDAATESNDEILEIGENGHVRDLYESIIRKIITANR